jgi:FMN-dependent oxidoreductase (nitrilotriacetate monooxygenase family)
MEVGLAPRATGMTFHLAWFGESGPSSWLTPANRIYDWSKPDLYQDVARLCERAKFDLVLFSDTSAIPRTFRGSTDYYVENAFLFAHDPMPTMAMMAAVTSRIGLASTVSTSFYPPFLAARLLATLDHLTSGRIGWNVVTSTSRFAAQNFGLEDLPEHDSRYDIADEYLELCRRLWDSWEPDAVVQDHATRRFADPAKVHSVDFAGRHFRARGPLNVTSSPQRRPVTIMAGASPRGLRFAVQNAEMVIAHKNTVADMRKYSDALRGMLDDAGRDPWSCKIFFAVKPILGDTETIARENLALHRANSPIERGLADLSNTLGHDFSTFDLDQPLPQDLPIKGLKGKFLQYQREGQPMTLREIAQHEALHETIPMCGTPAQVADMMEQAAVEGGADGFHFRAQMQDYTYLLDVATKLVPVLQDRGLVRRDYTGRTLREHLFEF